MASLIANRFTLLLLFCPLLADASLYEELKDDSDTVYVCDSKIYCQGPLLEAVNVLSLYPDSKTFVDMPLKAPPDDVSAAFLQKFGTTPPEKIDKKELQTFVDQYFSAPGTELQACTPEDWKPNPKKIMNITDPELRQWALALHGIWKELCKKMNDSISNAVDRYSLIYVPNEFIAPGGRFREFYYWDAYWIVKGLIASEMTNSVKNMINNLASMVMRFGFVPNGGRVYYLQRSQPPMLSGMVYEYYESTHDTDFLLQILPMLELELQFWKTNRTRNVILGGQNYTVYQYRTNSNTPRPESMREDVASAKDFDSPATKAKFWQNIASAAEAGWDFSTRWFSDATKLTSIEITNVVPIDLNAIICWNLDILEYLYERVGNTSKSEQYREERAKFREALNAVFYNDTIGAWFDYNIRTGLHNVKFYPSVAVPLFTGCYHNLNLGKSDRLFEYMDKAGVFLYPGGVPTSLVNNSGEQWDFPNGWSNLNHMIIEGLRKSENPEMQDQAFRLAQKWVLGNFKVFNATKHMWEKYNVIGDVPLPGSGGEYDVQDGFGWTNGVILDLLLTYNDRLALPLLPTTQSSSLLSLWSLMLVPVIMRLFS